MSTLGAVDAAEVTPVSLTLEGEIPFISAVAEAYGWTDLDLGHGSLIVSWNFKHIVHYQKIPMYNAVNVLHGFPEISIYSPSEVIDYEAEDL